MIGRRHFLTGSAAVVTTIAAHRGGLADAAEPPPETTRVRLGAVPSICLSPQYVAEDLLRAEGFTDIRYSPASGGVPGAKEMGAGARKIGHVVVNSATDRPWSQYFCCMVVANREFVARHPVATKRALRAILKGDQVCALDPARAARAYRDRGFDGVPEPLVLQALKEVPFGQWRAYDPADTLRFYALRLHEAGMIKASPQKILAQGTDWRFLNELKKELKG